jgi:glycine betaine/choline ABC-type transport system substrate-binding protein
MPGTDALAKSWSLLAAIRPLLSACGGSQTPNTTVSGRGKPLIVLGDKDSNDEVLLGELYAQAFRAKGFIVDLTPHVGGTQQIDTVFRHGQINAYPEYLGDVASTDGAVPDAGVRPGNWTRTCLKTRFRTR